MKVLSSDVCPEMQIQREIVSSCRQALLDGYKKRNEISTVEDWEVVKKEYMEVILKAFPEVLFKKKQHLHSRVISTYKLDDCRIENVIFESLPGWEVNGTVYLPEKPGRYPGVICPTGHSSKVQRNYQCSAKMMAQNGYIAISFDPPGCSGEKQYMNDHFTNGVLGYLTGFWSMTYFVADALKAIDYMETRDDVDSSAGFTMTGVSGGGLTSIFSTLLDERIKFCAPVCCLSEHEKIHLSDLYTSCPEQFGKGFIAAGIDYADYLCMIAPRPCLVIAGKKDEVFDVNSTIRLFNEAAHIYELSGNRNSFGLFIDENAGHAYTVRMAGEVVSWMNRIIKGIELPALDIDETDFVEIEKEKLLCHPSNSVNMFTINRDEAEKLKCKRLKINYMEKAKDILHKNVMTCLGLTDNAFNGFTKVMEYQPELRWFHSLQKVDILRDKDIHIPGLLMKHASRKDKMPALLFIDESGKWEGFKHKGFLTGAAGFLEEVPDKNAPLVLSIDVSGIGELSPEPSAYDLAEWNDIERILTYLSIANGIPVMGLRVRDALAALAYLENRKDVDTDRIMVGGRGIGAVVALHVAIIWGKASKIICMDMLSHYGALIEEFPNSWPQSIILPWVLRYYDIPDMIQCLAEKSEVYVLNPLDALRIHIQENISNDLYCETIKRNGLVYCGLDGNKMYETFVKLILY